MECGGLSSDLTPIEYSAHSVAPMVQASSIGMSSPDSRCDLPQRHRGTEDCLTHFPLCLCASVPLCLCGRRLPLLWLGPREGRLRPEPSQSRQRLEERIP